MILQLIILLNMIDNGFDVLFYQIGKSDTLSPVNSISLFSGQCKVIVYFGPQIAQIYADFRPVIRPAIFAEIRSSRIFKDYFLRVGNNETNKQTKEE
ncbi:MAG: hypothetical protein LBE12_18280 [Planctomycetaceae bacterium]|jgi:hypothetical protein|nr:hypothetical protein [Planctomycetaceae bacterium]